MAKVKVHELAKELGIESKNIIEFLKGTEYEAKAPQSSLEDNAQDMVRKNFGKKETPKAEAETAKPATEEVKERPKKKASIAAVFNPQYSKQQPQRRPGGANGQQRRPGSKPEGERNGARPENRGPRREGAPKQEQHTIIKPRPVGERAMRPISERTPNHDELVMTSTPKQEAAPVVETQQKEKTVRTERPQGERPARNDRPQNGKDGFRGNDRTDRNDRNGGKRSFDREMDKFNKDAAVPADDVRGKESRERNDRRNNNNNNKRQDRDKLGKKQENFINLEKNGGKKKHAPQPQKPKEDPNEIKTITLPEKMTIKELADAMKVQPSVIIKNLFMKGKMVTMNHDISFEEAEEIALEFNVICEQEEKVDVIAELLKEDEENENDLVPRSPVVCVMGHVDHGKTSLLDAIRSTKVTAREAGGITQHIGASVVSINGQNITFLDTPGHEAFTAMRMRGANSTDIAILVVAADDGVMPQTVEAINHAKAAGVEIIVAINKIDKPTANIDRVKQELSEYQLIPEDWGGSTVFCPVSAHTKEGIENLLEMILLTSEVLELKANPKRKARGLVIEAQLDKGRGAVATVLVQKGTLRVGDPIACGSSYGKVRAMIDDNGCRVKEAGPSTPVEILGLNSVPVAGETFVNTDSEKEAKSFAETYIAEEKNRLLEETKARMSLDDLFSQIQSGNMKELNIIVKADVQGSVEAVKQ